MKNQWHLLTNASAFFLAFCVSVSTVVGQESGGGTGIQIMSLSTTADSEGAVAGAAMPAFNFASSSITGIDPNNRSELFGLLTNKSVRDALKLSDEQYAGVRQIQKESNAKIQQMVSQLVERQAGQSSIRIGGGEFQKAIEEKRALSAEAIEEILLPEQLARIQQLAYQIEVAQLGLGESLTEGKLGEAVEVYDNQKQMILDRAAAIEAKTKAAIAKLKAEARAELLTALSPDQKKKAEELLGDYFSYEEVSLQKQLMRSMRARNQASDEEAAQPQSTKSRSDRRQDR